MNNMQGNSIPSKLNTLSYGKPRYGWIVLLLYLCFFYNLTTASAGEMVSSAAVFMYHRFGESNYPSTNIRIEQFKAHLNEIRNGSYKVLPLPEIVAAFRRKEPLPDRAIALTIDDAFLSVYDKAWPLIKKAGLPFTLFVATDVLDAERPGYMSWEQVRALAAAGVTIGSQTASHPHLPTLKQTELEEEFMRSNSQFLSELGFAPVLLAYPFGEFGLRERKTARDLGFIAAFGQHSGIAHSGEDIFGLPRFAMNEKFSSMKRFRLAGNGLPLPVFDVLPIDTVIRGNNPPNFGFTVADDINGLEHLACFASNMSGATRIERLGSRRFEVRLKKSFSPGRGRINCTLKANENRWRWFGRQFYIPKTLSKMR